LDNHSGVVFVINCKSNNMKAIGLVALFGALVAATPVPRAIPFPSRPRVPTAAPRAALATVLPTKGFAVVELFTSEGCSSCPPADALVARIQQESKDEPVYILAFHVDYWNRLGWKDGFSDADYSQRQKQYASWLRLQSVYTPQIVVNGEKEFVGSEETTLRKAINKGLQTTSTARLTLNGIRLDQGKVDWQYQTQDAEGNNLSLVVAVVQRSATTNVKAGENNGRTLAHVQIVRTFTTSNVKDKDKGAGYVALPQDVSPRDEEIIAFLQNNDNGRIIAATSSALP
jgi:hypothetical protein